MPVLAPEVQLLFKARDLRPKDAADFEAVLPALDAARRAWLSRSIARAMTSGVEVPRPAAASDPAAAPAAPTHDEAGVDLTLIRWMLALTPRERLRRLQQSINATRRLQHARRTDR